MPLHDVNIFLFMITEDGSLLKRSSRKGVNPEVPVTVEEREIVNPGIAELEYPLRALLLKLFPHVEADEYSLMVGEGLSATIPTLVMRAAINDTRLLDGKDQVHYKKSENKWVLFGQGIQEAEAIISEFASI